MASVFLSYDREDAVKARAIAVALEEAGHSVWWDRHIKSGTQYSKAIEDALKRADAVVVLWSQHSVESAWVRDEAAAGRDSGRLVPIKLDKTEPPIGFRQYQALDLSEVRRRIRSTQLKELLAGIGEVSPNTIAQPTPHVEKPTKLSDHRRWMVAVMAAIILLAGSYAGWRYFRTVTNVPTVAVAAADTSPATEALSRDLLVKLGALQSARADEIRLLEQDQPRTRANLIFEVSGSGGESGLTLLNGKDRAVLWSRNFSQPSGNPADLKQQVAYTAAFVLDCALEGLSTTGKKLSQSTLKLYLNGCAASADTSDSALADLVDTFREVTTKAPDFEAGWAKLLMVESAIVDDPDLENGIGEARQVLRGHIDAARKLNPRLPEADLAEASLVSPAAIGRRIGLVERAVANDPRSAAALSSHSLYLQRVGRMRDAIHQARRAVELEPLSPQLRDSLIGSLTYAGQFESALQELEKAERLWPGATSLADARYRIHLRYGDPREALRMQPSRKDLATEVRKAFLQAVGVDTGKCGAGNCRPAPLVSTISCGDCGACAGARGVWQERGAVRDPANLAAPGSSQLCHGRPVPAGASQYSSRSADDRRGEAHWAPRLLGAEWQMA